MAALIVTGLILLAMVLLVFEISLQLREVDANATVKVIERKA